MTNPNCHDLRSLRLMAAALAVPLLLPATALAIQVGNASLHVPVACSAPDVSQHRVDVLSMSNLNGGSVELDIDYHEAGQTARDSWIFRFKVGSSQQVEKSFADVYASTDSACDQKLQFRMQHSSAYKSFPVKASAHHGTSGWWGGAFVYHDYYDEATIHILGVPASIGGFVPGNPGGQ